MKKQFDEIEYKITTKPEFEVNYYKTTPELRKLLNILLPKAQNPNDQKIIHNLTELIIVYPDSPHLKNLLSIAYHVRKNFGKALEVNDWCLKEHPDYLFAKLNKAHDYIQKGQPEKVTELLGEDLEINLLYPHREVFHLSEVTGFQKSVIRYYLAIQQADLAQKRMDILFKLAPDHPDTYSSQEFIHQYNLGKSLESFQLASKISKIKPEILRRLLPQTKKEPQFNHKEIKQLYLYDVDIPGQFINEILSLPTKTLIEDLEKILIDADKRFVYFLNSGNTQEYGNSCVFHALCLLKEIKAVESLAAVLDFLRHDDQFLEFWLGDHLTEHIWQCLFTLGKPQINLLADFLLEPGLFTFSKSEVSVALSQIALHDPSRIHEISEIYEIVFTKYLNAKAEDNIIDTDFLELAMADAMDCRIKSLLPILKQLFDKGYIDHSMAGNYNEVVVEFEMPIDKIDKRAIQSLFEIYQEVLTEWFHENESEEFDNIEDDDEFPDENVNDKNNLDDFLDDHLTYRTPFMRYEPKFGRNDPCICGSGLKFKKCCLGKFES